MGLPYYVCRVSITNTSKVYIDRYDTSHQDMGRLECRFKYSIHTKNSIQNLHELASTGELKGDQVRDLGEKLFDIIFDLAVYRKLYELYERSRQEGALLRFELDIDEESELNTLPVG